MNRPLSNAISAMGSMAPFAPPPGPAESEWHFIEELKQPSTRTVRWQRTSPEPSEVSLADGLCLLWLVSDERGLLDTAKGRFLRFIESHGIPLSGPAAYPISVELGPIPEREAYRVEVTQTACRVVSGDIEGLRRAMAWLEDQLASAERPFLPLGIFERKAAIRTRISRCFFGPIQRPPQNRDELADEVDYYPDAYLERLAHEGVNGLWLTLRFSDVCRTEFFPHHGHDRDRRLAKLRRTVEKCARYGIRIFPFCIEPRAFGESASNAPRSDLALHPELAGHPIIIDGYPQEHFCTSTPEGLAYLEAATGSLFSAVPELGGLIMINMGERPTHCYSALPNFFENRCPRCSKREPWQVFHDTLAAIARGMHASSPNAELISWLYIPSLSYKGSTLDEGAYREAIEAIAAHIPKGVTLQLNFESSGISEQLGRPFIMQDYSLAYIGPSPLFESCAELTRHNATSMAAKLQVGCSHEVATVPFVPVPGHLFRKYKAMQQLGVDSVMQCWYFGNYPSLMTKAAGELSFSPFPENETVFLERLARLSWSGDASTITAAWQHFHAAYEQFPRNLSFSHFGPVHDCIAWPLHLFPVDTMIAPSWRLGSPPSGDRIGELLGQDYLLSEMLAITEAMQREWYLGVKLMESLLPRYSKDRERRHEIGVAQALGLQLRSAWNVLRFYALRERLPYSDTDAPTKLALLGEMEAITRDEIAGALQLASLCRDDTRLGFHSEAEGYRYHPALLCARVVQLEALLANDFLAIRKAIEDGVALFPAFTGEEPEGASYFANKCRPSPSSFPSEHEWAAAPVEICSHVRRNPLEHCPPPLPGAPTQWQCLWDDSHLYIRVVSHELSAEITSEQGASDGPQWSEGRVSVSIEPRRLWPGIHFNLTGHGQKYSERLRSVPGDHWHAVERENLHHRVTEFTIPWTELGERAPAPERLRINVVHWLSSESSLSWVPLNPVAPRTCLGTYNPNDYGWLFLASAASD